MNILVTGGAGYIGSHTIIELYNAGHNVVCIDNFINSSLKVKKRIESIIGKSIDFYNIDIRNSVELEKIVKLYNFDCCIHFASLKSINESICKPLEYYDNNLSGTISLLNCLKKYQCKNIIFSSSATVYGKAKCMPITEDTPKEESTNPYGETKNIIERILMDLYKSDKEWNIVLLRYFNPIGAHKSGLIGECPKGIPNNLMPYITQVASKKRKELLIYGNTYDTVDGTGVRDYIHVVDLAIGHVKALKVIEEKRGLKIYNLGTGRGYSVLEIVKAFEMVNNIKIPYKIVNKREGDVAECYSDSSKANKELGWNAKYNIYDMCRDAWNWQKNNPDGYR